MESTEPVFRVMGQFLGLFVRTHEFFQGSLIYYVDRPDLMIPMGDSLISTPGFRVCWEGQAEGLEGLRQKGWSLFNLLALLRVLENYNTKVKIVAQGDNQLIITKYKIMVNVDPVQRKKEIQKIIDNNSAIMSGIMEATGKLGLIINRDEVSSSADFFIYGKVPIFRGKLIALETKKWSRVNAMTNNILPTFSNSMATVSTGAMSINQHSPDPFEVIRNF